MSLDLYATLQREEGERLKLYTDHLGYWTIGIGHCLANRVISYEDACRLLDLKMGRKCNGQITDQESMTLLIDDVDHILDNIKSVPVLGDIFRHAEHHIQDCLILMSFQLGMHGVAKFKNMLTALHQRNYHWAAQEALASKWAKQTPNRANRVANYMAGGSYW